jgi:hypothetical protein
MKRKALFVPLCAAAVLLLLCSSSPDVKKRKGASSAKAQTAAAAAPAEAPPAKPDIFKDIKQEISRSLRESLVVPDSYKALSFEADSAFAPYHSPEFITLTLTLMDRREEYDGLTVKTGGRLSKAEARECEAALQANLAEQKHCMAQMTKFLHQGRYHIGWLLRHRFAAGLSEHMEYYIVGPSGQRVDMRLSAEDMDRYRKFLETDGKWFVFEKYHNE